MKAAPHAWIGPAPTRVQVAVILTIAALAITVSTSLPPILLGGLVAEGRLTLVELGQTATAELIAMALVCSVAGALFAPTRLRQKATVAGGGLIVANLLTLVSAHHQIMLARALSGGCFGIHMWILTVMLMRSPDTARQSGAVSAIQAVAAVLLSYGIRTLGAAGYGINGGYGMLAAISLAMTLGMAVIPSRFEPIPGSGPSRMPPPRGLAGLAVIFLYLAGVIGMWVYVGALAAQAGYTPGQTATAVSLALGAQLAGALTTAAFGHRIPALPAVAIGGIGLFAHGIALTTVLPLPGFYAAAALFGLLWMFATPFLIPLILEIDTTRVSALYAITVQMIGAACGPALCALFIAAADVRRAVVGTGVLVVAAVIVAIATRVVARRGAPA